MTLATGTPEATARFDRVLAWLDRQGFALERPVDIVALSGGRSNLTYELTDGDGKRFVLRRPPDGTLLPTAHDVSREWMFIRDLHGSPVPAPPPVAYCQDPSVLGAPFFIMGYVDGFVLAEASDAANMSPSARRAAGTEMIDVLVKLHSVDIGAISLPSLPSASGYISRQLRRWQGQWDNSQTPEVPGARELFDQLTSSTPPQRRTAIVHGDYRLGNILFDSAGHLQSVLDWELATIGDPMADVGWAVMWWDSPLDPVDLAPLSSLPGFPTSAELVKRYATQSGADVSELRFYIAFNMWRTLSIWAGSNARQPSETHLTNNRRFSVGRWDRPEAIVDEALTLLRQQ
jgi:aminoglycoside phosphotransferase (APT) family kinase protein